MQPQQYLMNRPTITIITPDQTSTATLYRGESFAALTEISDTEWGLEVWVDQEDDSPMTEVLRWGFVRARQPSIVGFDYASDMPLPPPMDRMAFRIEDCRAEITQKHHVEVDVREQTGSTVAAYFAVVIRPAVFDAARPPILLGAFTPTD